MKSPYESILLSDDEKIFIESQMAKCYKALDRASFEKYGFAKIKKLRQDYKVQKSLGKGYDFLWSDPEARQMIEWMISNEQKILSAYINLCMEMCRKFSVKSVSDLTFEDCLQEAVFAIYDAMYLYNGEFRFSTYVFTTVRHRLLNAKDKLEEQKGIDRFTKLNLKKVYEIINKESCSFDQAISQIKFTEKELKKDVIRKLRNAYNGTTYLSVEDFDRVACKEDKKTEAIYDILSLAIEKANLTDIQRRMLFAMLNGEKNFNGHLINNEVNPNTGMPWTRQRLHQLQNDAQKKLKIAYDNLDVA